MAEEKKNKKTSKVTSKKVTKASSKNNDVKKVVDDKIKKTTALETTNKNSVAKAPTHKKTRSKRTKKNTNLKNDVIKEKQSLNSEQVEKTKEFTLNKEEAKEKVNKEENLEKTLIFDGTQNKNLEEVVDKLEEDNVVLKDKVIKRSKVKKVVIIILIIAILSIIIGTSAYVVNERNKEKENNQTINSNIYNKVSKNLEKGDNQEESENVTVDSDDSESAIKYENIKTISLNEFEDKVVDKEDMIILVSKGTCYACLSYEPIVDEVFKDNKKIIYRIDVSSLNDEETERFRSYYAFLGTPSIFRIKDGIVSSEIIKTKSKEDLDEWVKEQL